MGRGKKIQRSDDPEPGPAGPWCWGLCGCCTTAGDVLLHEVNMTAAAIRAPPPIELEAGYAHESGAARGEPPPTEGWFEVVNKTKGTVYGGTIAVLAATNAAELALRGHDVHGHLSTHVARGLMPEQTVMHGRIPPGAETLQVALFYGARYPDVERMEMGECAENFEFVKGYQVSCCGKNVLLKFKEGELQLQKGELRGIRKRSVGGGIDMRTNVAAIDRIEPEAKPIVRSTTTRTTPATMRR